MADCNFLDDLPVEVRTLIYIYAFHSEASRIESRPGLLHIEQRGKKKFELVNTKYKNGGLSAQLLRVCKTIHGEALPALYGHRGFWIYYYEELVGFLHRIGNDARTSIKRIDLWEHKNRASNIDLPIVVSELKQCTSLKEFSFTMNKPYWQKGQPDFLPACQYPFAELQGLKKVIIRQGLMSIYKEGWLEWKNALEEIMTQDCEDTDEPDESDESD